MATNASRDNDAFLREDVQTTFSRINVPLEGFMGADLSKHSPIDGDKLCELRLTDDAGLDRAITDAQQAFLSWRTVPAPERGKLVYTFAELVRRHKAELASIVTLDCGKTETEALGEIQEVIDICDFAIGLSRQLYGLTIATERPEHRMAETWHPLGIFGQITAFNFPAAVWSWGAMIALVCGDSVIWKPSEKSPLTAIALCGLLDHAIAACGNVPAKLSQLVLGDAELGKQLASDTRIPLVSATGSTTMGRDVAVRVAARLGRSTLELGGNNAAIVSDKADLDLALRGVAFAAVGTAGQRCTSLRRLIVHEAIADEFVARLKAVYAQLRIGRPDDPKVHVGPLIDERAYDQMLSALRQATAEGGSVFGGERVLADRYPHAFYVNPAIASMPSQSGIVERETFAPILFVMTYASIDGAIALQNGVSQGLSSAIFTTDMREAEYFLSASGSDCGIANVNIGTSGAEIGGAFGGEKATGGGRAAGSDTWKAFMRRATNTVNYSLSLPLAQGVEFNL